MEYGYEITDTAGNKTFFVEGCTYCSMSTGGLHEQHCPLRKQQLLVTIKKIQDAADAILEREG